MSVNQWINFSGSENFEPHKSYQFEPDNTAVFLVRMHKNSHLNVLIIIIIILYKKNNNNNNQTNAKYMSILA